MGSFAGTQELWLDNSWTQREPFLPSPLQLIIPSNRSRRSRFSTLASPKSYEDAGQGRGIVPLMNVPKQDGESQELCLRRTRRGRSDFCLSIPLFSSLFLPDEQELAEPGSESSSMSSSDEEEEDAHHYADTTKDSSKGKLGRLFERFSVNGLTERMLRKTVRKNTWIYVADMDGNRG